MKPYGYVRIVRVWCGIHTNPILGCFGNPEGLNYVSLLVGVVPELSSYGASLADGILGLIIEVTKGGISSN
jgi:hypothetical protein